jgi:hypothetical protein
MKKMSKCIECGKMIGIFGSYRHPVYGKNKYVCVNCFNMIDNMLEKWTEFILSNSFNNEKTNIKLNDIITQFSNFNNNLSENIHNFFNLIP